MILQFLQDAKGLLHRQEINVWWSSAHQRLQEDYYTPQSEAIAAHSNAAFHYQPQNIQIKRKCTDKQDDGGYIYKIREIWWSSRTHKEQAYYQKLKYG